MTDNSICEWCGTKLTRFRKKCPRCGKSKRAPKIERAQPRTYTGVRMQQGRVATDSDWDETTRISSSSSRVHDSKKCQSCGTANKRSSLHCRNCGANL